MNDSSCDALHGIGCIVVERDDEAIWHMIDSYMYKYYDMGRDAYIGIPDIEFEDGTSIPFTKCVKHLASEPYDMFVGYPVDTYLDIDDLAKLAADGAAKAKVVYETLAKHVKDEGFGDIDINDLPKPKLLAYKYAGW